MRFLKGSVKEQERGDQDKSCSLQCLNSLFLHQTTFALGCC